MLEASGYLYMWVLKIGGIQNLIAQSLLKFWNYPFHFHKFLAIEPYGLQGAFIIFDTKRNSGYSLVPPKISLYKL